MNDKSARTKRTALFIYTMGRAIQVQNQFVEANFKRHPTIATVINQLSFVQQQDPNLEVCEASEQVRQLCFGLQCVEGRHSEGFEGGHEEMRGGGGTYCCK